MSLFCCMFFKKARSPIFPLSYHSTAGVSSIDRPILSATNLYTQRQTTMAVTSMAMQHSSNLSTFSTNLSTNQETTLAQVCGYHFKLKIFSFFSGWKKLIQSVSLNYF